MKRRYWPTLGGINGDFVSPMEPFKYSGYLRNDDGTHLLVPYCYLRCWEIRGRAAGFRYQQEQEARPESPLIPPKVGQSMKRERGGVLLEAIFMIEIIFCLVGCHLHLMRSEMQRLEELQTLRLPYDGVVQWD